jgi:hypothetical protein
MATVDTAAIAAALNQMYEDQLASQINRATVLAQIIPVETAKGKNVAWPVRLGTATASAIEDGANVTVFNSDEKKNAVLDFATYHDAFGVSGRALSAAANSGGPADLADLFDEHIMEASERLASKLNQEMYSGTGGSAPETIAGLNSVALTATGEYGGLDRTTYPQWAATVDANGGTPRALSLDLMRRVRRLIYVASGKKPDIIVCDPFQHEAYGKLMGQQRRYVQEVTVRGQLIKLDGGYQVLEFDGIPVLEDKDAPAGKMFFLNTSQCRIRVLPDAASRFGQGSTGLKGTEEEQMGMPAAKLTGRIQPLAVTGDMFKFAVFTYLQLQVRTPNSCGVLADLATS